MNRVNLLLLVLLVFFSCTGRDDNSIEEKNNNLYNVDLELDGFEVSVEAITRGETTKTIYGINVYYDKEQDGKTNDFYAYGLFDTTDKMKITLIGGYKYRFVCSIVRDSDLKLYYGPYGSNNFSGYSKPFQLSGSASTAVQNKFLIGTAASGNYLSGMGSGKAVVQSSNSSGYEESGSYPSLERYYGEYDNYEPVQNDKVIIPVKKTFFGNKLIVTGVSDGKVNVTCQISSYTIWTVTNLTSDYENNGSIYSYSDVYDCWKNEPTLDASVSFIYYSNRGQWWNLSETKSVTFKRNVMTTIKINLTPDFSGASIGVAEEPMGNDNEIILEGNNGQLIEVIVDPQN